MIQLIFGLTDFERFLESSLLSEGSKRQLPEDPYILILTLKTLNDSSAPARIHHSHENPSTSLGIHCNIQDCPLK